MRIITGTILMVSLMIPTAVIAEVTHKVSGNVTITKYKEGDQFEIWYIVRDSGNTPHKVYVKQLGQIQDNGTYPFEISCDPDHIQLFYQNYHSCENEVEPAAELHLIVNGSQSNKQGLIQVVSFE